ncbi:tetraacyldisaccharide 4'-kinase [Thermaurantimonas aggregans]|uniref:Tetraacyldisaccharide 4'-kinase n=2 Tax=Schleiferiaceae TaxID=1333713 RepID=A0A401XJ19_9FLAO|nr:tetraacyldisaccharide 4'-kinase [Thermaurantimonas aggregans]
MTLFLTKELSNEFKIAILSRGYGRVSKGFLWVDDTSAFLEVGDEPLLLKKNLPNIPVAVCERRVDGVKKILQKFPDTQVVILDDALQHRAIVPDIKILLTTWNQPFSADALWPIGTLRDVKSRAKYVDAIVVTKTPVAATTAEKEKIISSLQKYSNAPIFFSHNHNYFFPPLPENKRDVVIVTTIANPSYVLNFLSQWNLKIIEKFLFKDHYPISHREWEAIFETCNRKDALCIMTDKEYVKLPSVLAEKFNNTIYVLKLTVDIENKIEFLNLITKKLSYD